MIFGAAHAVGSSPLHAARAGITAAFCASLWLWPILFEHPLVLGAAGAAVVVAASLAGAGRELRRAALFGLPVASAFALLNPLVAQQGQTLLVRGYEIAGTRFDVTLEALAYGAVAGLRLLVLVMAFGLLSATVDADELLRAARRVLPRAALTSALAIRLVPLLAADGRRLAEAVRLRPDPPGRLAVVRVAAGGALERALDVAAALELRGYPGARPPRPHTRRSRHDLRVAAAAVAIAAGAVAARIAGAAAFVPYPRLELALGPAELAIAAGLVSLAAVPFAGRGARLGVPARA